RIAQSDTYLFPSAGGSGVDVYVIDSGIDVNHPEFEGRARHGISFVEGGRFGAENPHGTHVAGTIGSRRFGVAPNAVMIDVRVFGPSGGTSMDTIIRAISWSVEEAKRTGRKSVINLSLGGPGRSHAEESAVRAAVEAGVYVVVAGGNSNRNACNFSPAFAPSAITVGATAIDDRPAGFTNFGQCIDIMAPGVDVESTMPGGGSDVMSGTSMAAPHVAGVMALLLSERDFGSVAEGTNFLLEVAARDVVRDNKPDTIGHLLYNARPRVCTENPCRGLVL
ncbi:Secreted subtilisin-like serine protease sub4, partial [Quaeritorhiza haematococci]